MNLHVFREKRVELVYPVREQFQESSVESSRNSRSFLLYSYMVQGGSRFVCALEGYFALRFMDSFVYFIDEGGVSI